MKCKVCGITRLEQLQSLETLGADYAGLIFYEGSKRFVGERKEEEKKEMKNSAIKKVGVFVNATYETVLKAIKEYGLYAVQLHGDETDEFCLELMDKVKVIKVFRVKDEAGIDEMVKPFEAVCHYFLFDTDTDAYGGSGKRFDWSLLQKAKVGKPFFLSGGIGPEDKERLRAFRHPHLYAVDVNSKFEIEPGVKDLKKVEAFLTRLKNENG
jgi:phosphoribosylanthranilate isomerase